jgi:uncharacterized cupin superfamily protein
MATHQRDTSALLTAAVIAAMKEERRVHVLNPGAVRNQRSLGDAVGMKDLGIHLVRIEPGRETTEYHTHYCDEEFVYILSGRGIADIDDTKFEVGPGDFMGFTARSAPHTMSNAGSEDLVYLVGGTRKPFDVSEYPRAKKRAYKFAGERHTVDYDDVK